MIQQQKTSRLEIEVIKRDIFPNIGIKTNDGDIFATVRYWGLSFEEQGIVLANQSQIYFWIKDHRDSLKKKRKKK